MAISAKFEADFSQFQTAVATATGSLTNLEGTAKTLGPAILASLASHQVRQFATDVAAVATQFIGAFAEEEAAVNKLGVALKAQGTEAYLEQYKALASQFQRTTVNSDDLVLSMTALLVQVGNVAPAQMQAALTASADLSAGLGISLEAATMLVAKAFGQGGEQLGRLKALLGDTVPKGADMAQVMEAINSKFGGQAAAQLDTYTGKVAALNNQMSDFKEKVGGLLVDGLTPLLNAFTSLPEGMQTTIVAVVAIGTALAPLLVSAAALIPIVTGVAAAFGGAAGLAAALAVVAPFVVVGGIIAAGIVAWYQVFKNLDVFVWAAVKAWEALTGAFKTAATAIVGYAKSMYEGVYNWLVVKFQGIVDWVNQKIAAIIAAFKSMYMAVQGGSIVPDMIQGIASEFQKLDGVMVQPVIQATRQVTNQFAGVGSPMLSPAASAAGSGRGVVNNTFNIVDNTENIGRKVAAQITDNLNRGGPV